MAFSKLKTDRKLVSLASIIALTLCCSGHANADVIQFSEDNVTAFCKKEWTKRGQLDQEMFDYCARQQREGYQNLMDLADKNKESKWIGSLIAYSESKWTDKGITDYQMMAFQVNKEVEGFLDIEYEKNNGNVSGDKLSSCMSKWVTDEKPQFSMVAYCIKQD